MLSLYQVIIQIYRLNNIFLLSIFILNIINKMLKVINIIINRVLVDQFIIKIYLLRTTFLPIMFLFKIINKIFQNINLMNSNLVKGMEIKLERILKIILARIKSRINNIMRLVK